MSILLPKPGVPHPVPGNLPSSKVQVCYIWVYSYELPSIAKHSLFTHKTVLSSNFGNHVISFTSITSMTVTVSLHNRKNPHLLNTPN